MRRAGLLSAGLLAIVMIGGCGSNETQPTSKKTEGAIDVITNFYPVQWLAQHVGEGVADVTSLTPPGAEPHDLQLDAKTIGTMGKADVVLYMGDQFQPEVEKAAKALPGSVVKRDLMQAPNLDLVAASHEGEASGNKEEEHGANDPHVWLDPVRMKALAVYTAGALKEAAPTKTDVIDANLARTVVTLDGLDSSMKQQLTGCAQPTIVTSHAAFGYLAARYGLKQLPIAGISPDEDPNPKALQEIAATAKSQNVSTVYFEDKLPANLSKTVAQEIGAKTDLLSAVEFDPAAETPGADYVSVQNDNARRLHAGLSCQG